MTGFPAFRAALFAALLLGPLLPSAGPAAASEEHKEGGGESKNSPLTVDVENLTVPLINDAGRPVGALMLTLTLEGRDAPAADDVKSRIPHIRDMIENGLTVQVRRGIHVDAEGLTALKRDVGQLLDTYLGRGTVAAVYVVFSYEQGR